MFSRPPVSSAAKQAVKAAFEQLEKAILPEDACDFTTKKLDDVRKAALALENQLAAPLGAERDFQETLAVFYVNILQYHEQAYTFVRRKGWKVLFLTSWGRFERRFDNILDDMKRHEKLVDLQASVHGISDVRQLRDDIKSWREESRAQIHKWHEKQAIKQYDSIVSWLKSEESDQLAIFDAISSEGAKFAGTCSWVLSNSRIKAWLGRATDPSVLWLQGTPGSGKSVLILRSIILQLLPDGMFLYARLVLDYLSKNIFYTGSEMRRSIDELPEKLSELYSFSWMRDYHEKASRVVKGIHGFHVYATEFWTEYVLHYFSTQPPSDNSIVLNLATKLAERLGERPDTEDAQNNSSPSPPVDERLKHLKDWPRLINLVEASLRSRSLKRLESNLEVVRFLLQQDEYPGISAADLYLFKSQFQSSAFTCRLSFCPRATNGFSSEELRRQHEIAHTQLSLCTVPECRYPPFTSIKALKAHINKYHRPEKRTRHIRRNGSVSLRQRYLDAGVEPSVERLAHRGKSAELSGIKHNSSPTSRSTATALRRIRVENSSNSTETPGQTKEGRRLSVSSQAMDMDDDNNVFNLDEILQVPIASIGFRGCTIANCGYPFGAWSEEYCDDNDTDNVVSYHYWNWHHADSMAQCAVTGCQMIFSSGQGLKAHYKKRHTALFCTSCDEHYPDGHSTDETLTHFLEPYVRRVWAYEVVKREEVPRYTQGWTFTMEGSDEEEEEALNNTLYFIEDLA
ncbi:hypothetical protein FGSG_07735 [Fusarium graminearum PH-1]|uniref:hypothetical protein n=1 Tax=Gibberella zeae (strain ATCC MYA-4620 / CBS 123657 / FGSC 9075 / NRRL 31084 / PH-1) TaxID=229533 RepID=UPI00021F23F5|nr:hypothetical protein FGSG_07735 [Fusarium graminearum PH-1]ESU14037.1 hypothetical protein FGSG_07735 [Fusarium graminearum PH-1]|eukprot:XP_011327544.1 hypothetical protein FGSG_07735 [Fusarium graminearum PH-1]